MTTASNAGMQITQDSTLRTSATLLPTVRLGYGRTAEVFAWGDRWVLKLFYAGCPRTHVEREAVLSDVACRAVRTCGRFYAPAPAGTINIGERHGLLFERIDADHLASALTKPVYALGDRMSAPAAVGQRLADVHVALHTIPPDLGDAGRSVPDQRAVIDRALTAVASISAHLCDAARRSLDELGEERRVFCHGDLHPLNVLIDRDGNSVVIDWSTLDYGTALCDVARTSLRIRFGRISPAHVISPAEAEVRCEIDRAYTERYLTQTPLPHAARDLSRWLPLIALVRMNDGIGAHERADLLPIVRKLANDSTRTSSVGGCPQPLDLLSGQRPVPEAKGLV